MKNRKHSFESLPSRIRTKSSRKLAGSKSNKPHHAKSKNIRESWNKAECSCGHLMDECPALRRITQWLRNPKYDPQFFAYSFDY